MAPRSLAFSMHLNGARHLRRHPLHGKVAPTRRSFDADGNDRILGNLHGPKLRVAGVKQCLRVIVLRPLRQDFRAPMQHYPSEPRPVLIVAIDHNRNRWILGDILQALKLGKGPALRLLINRYVERIAGHYEAHGHDMRDCPPVGSCQMSDP